MIWIALIVLVTLYVLYFIFRGCALLQGLYYKTNTTSAFGFFADYWKTCLVFSIVMLCLTLNDHRGHIVNMYDCTVQKTIHKAANSEYSWYNGECNFQDKNGVFINMKRVRGLPEGTEEHTEE
jgi:hypothetical protein